MQRGECHLAEVSEEKTDLNPYFASRVLVDVVSSKREGFWSLILAPSRSVEGGPAGFRFDTRNLSVCRYHQGRGRP
jgi:hypothetical protein